MSARYSINLKLLTDLMRILNMFEMHDDLLFLLNFYYETERKAREIQANRRQIAKQKRERQRSEENENQRRSKRRRIH